MTAPALLETWYELGRLATLPPERGGAGAGPAVRARLAAARHVDPGRAGRAGQHLRRVRPAAGLPGRARGPAGRGDPGRGGRGRPPQYLAPAKAATVVLGDAERGGRARSRPWTPVGARRVRDRSADARPLARSTLDRAAQVRTDAVWLAEAWQRARVLVVDDGRAMVAGRPPGAGVARPEAPAGRAALPRGRPGRRAVLRGARRRCRRPGPTTWPGRTASARSGTCSSTLDAGLLMTAVALANWHARHGYSPAQRAADHGARRRLGPGRRGGPADVAAHRPGRDRAGARRRARRGRRLPARQQRGLEPRPGRRDAALLLPGRLRRAGRVGRADRWSARWPRRSGCTSPICGTSRASRGRTPAR